MAKQRKTVMIIGEGITEFYYFNSLKDELKGLTITPDYPKNTNLKDLEKKIDEGIECGYDYIYCVIDMDTKEQESERRLYNALRQKYGNIVKRQEEGASCEVKFVETHRCTELFFLYHFEYTGQDFNSQKSLIDRLNRHCGYEKTGKFFKSCRGLHGYLEKKGGSLEKAIANAQLSIKAKVNGDREYTYSGIGGMLKELREIQGI